MAKFDLKPSKLFRLCLIKTNDISNIRRRPFSHGITISEVCSFIFATVCGMSHGLEAAFARSQAGLAQAKLVALIRYELPRLLPCQAGQSQAGAFEGSYHETGRCPFVLSSYALRSANGNAGRQANQKFGNFCFAHSNFFLSGGAKKGRPLLVLWRFPVLSDGWDWVV